MTQKQKRAMAVHDISCFGRCSLTVALPILSAAGIETAVIPTAVLSTHTGGFTGFTYRDLTDDILPVVKHWRSLGLSFDAIYTGFLGSFAQIDIVSEIFDLWREEEALLVVDPVMADDGKLYSIFPENFPAGMRRLCAVADVIVPNLTEAALLLNIPYNPGPFTREEIESLLHRLSALGPKRVVLTGVTRTEGPDMLGAASFDARNGEVAFSGLRRIDPMYHGTGDVFASALTAALLHGRSLAVASEAAVRFTVDSLKRTKLAGTDIRFGVNFEEGLTGLRSLIGAGN
ncbi:MAG: pyridoxamine kinase [Gracilibacteraceae bacterium]|jgi:pyridoxine kinase|nr:pyridoxamine kinase [Gracilibacteraceae bacterium]